MKKHTKEQFSQSTLNEVRPLPGSRVTTTPAHTQGASVPVSGALAKGIPHCPNFWGIFYIFHSRSMAGITGKKRRSPKSKSDISFFSQAKKFRPSTTGGPCAPRGCVRMSCCTRVSSGSARVVVGVPNSKAIFRFLPGADLFVDLAMSTFLIPRGCHPAKDGPLTKPRCFSNVSPSTDAGLNIRAASQTGRDDDD